MKANQPIIPIAYSKESAAAAFGVAQNIVTRWIERENDPLPAWRDGKRILIPVQDAQAWISRLAKAEPAEIMKRI